MMPRSGRTCMTKPMLRFMFLLGGAPLKDTSPSLRIMLRRALFTVAMRTSDQGFADCTSFTNTCEVPQTDFRYARHVPNCCTAH